MTAFSRGRVFFPTALLIACWFIHPSSMGWCASISLAECSSILQKNSNEIRSGRVVYQFLKEDHRDIGAIVEDRREYVEKAYEDAKRVAQANPDRSVPALAMWESALSDLTSWSEAHRVLNGFSGEQILTFDLRENRFRLDRKQDRALEEIISETHPFFSHVKNNFVHDETEIYDGGEKTQWDRSRNKVVMFSSPFDFSQELAYLTARPKPAHVLVGDTSISDAVGENGNPILRLSRQQEPYTVTTDLSVRHGFLLSRSVATYQGVVVEMVDVKDYRKLDGYWLPTQVDVVGFDMEGGVRSVQSYRPVSIELNAAFSDEHAFEISPDPFARVSDFVRDVHFSGLPQDPLSADDVALLSVGRTQEWNDEESPEPGGIASATRTGLSADSLPTPADLLPTEAPVPTQRLRLGLPLGIGAAALALTFLFALRRRG
ncbi:MAG: hypothetical protein RLY93_12510 [Sumerlaeia bacterium]